MKTLAGNGDAAQKASLSKLVQIICLLVLWAVPILMFWLGVAVNETLIGHASAFLYFVLPLGIIIISFFIGKDVGWGKLRWVMVPVFGLVYMLAEYLTFSLREMISTSFAAVTAPRFEEALFGTISAVIGMLIGSMVRKLKEQRQSRFH